MSLLDPRVEELFDAVADLPEDERERYLAAHCNDEDLRARVRELVLCDTPSGVRGAATLQPLERVGPYEILAPLGEGGMGTVYFAEQTEPIRRRVALKIIKLGMDTRQVVQRFEVERQVLALLDHEHIARVLDAGATGHGRPYFVMELVEGEPITAYCDARSLSVAARLALFLDVCGAVQHAHQRGIIHRDLKPGNVLVREDGVAKVIDFGVAKATSPDLRGTLTAHHQAVGTPEYMSPEQASRSEVDTRSDVYALGVLLNELLTGVTPHGRAKDYAEFERSLREVPAPTPSRHVTDTVAARRACTARVLRRQLRDGIDWVVLRCLEKEKNRRYESVAALARDIRAYLAHEPLAAGPPHFGYRVRTYLRRHRLGVAVAAAFLVVVVGFVVVLLQKSFEERRLRHRAESALHENRVERGRLLAMTGSLSLAERLLWGEYLARPTANARWALWEMYWRHPCVATRHCAGGVVRVVDVHPDGKILATGHPDAVVRLWSPDGLRPVATLTGHAGEVHAVAFTPDGTMLASAANDGTVRLWDVASGRTLRVLEAGRRLWTLALSPDGRRLAAGDHGGAVHVWDMATGRPTGMWRGPNHARRAMRFDRAGLVYSGNDDGAIDVIELRDDGPRHARRLEGHTRLILALELSADERRLYSGSGDRTVRVWDLATGAARAVDPGIGMIRGIETLPDGDVLVLSNRAIERWSGDMKERRMTVRDTTCATMAVAGGYYCIAGAGMFPDGRLAGRLRLFEIDPGRAARREILHEGAARTVAVTPRGIATGGADGVVRFAGTPLGRHAARVHCVRATADGRHLVSGAADNEVFIWDLERRAVVATCTGFGATASPWIWPAIASRPATTRGSFGSSRFRPASCSGRATSATPSRG